MKLTSIFLLIVLSAAASVAVDEGTPRQQATSEALGGAARYLSHVGTDKPVYRVGETIFARAVLLHAITHKPLDQEGVYGFVEVFGPKGERVASAGSQVQDSVAAFAWQVPPGQPGGQYTLRISYPQFGYAPAERQFEIRAYRTPRLKSQIVFLRDGYGPGDMVTATAKIERAEGGIPTNAKTTVIARVDGAEVYRGETSIDEAGCCTATFALPAAIARGDGTLAFVVEDGGVSETATKTIPILLQTVDLEVYPEGGELVAGLPNRVYFAARTPAQKPADIAGAIEDASGNVVAHFRSEHEGRGRFAFTPLENGRYTLRISEPAGITRTYDLPEVRTYGVVLRAARDEFAAGGPVHLRVGCTHERKLTITLCQHELEVSAVRLTAEPGVVADVYMTPPSTADGVLIATVCDESGAPLAERLVYRAPRAGLRITAAPSKSRYVPGAPVELTIKTTDDDGNPVSAVVGVTVTDDSVLEMIEKREQAPRLPVMVLLEPDVRDLADAHVYLDRDDPKAPLAVDLLLGTQGWRRFAFYRADEFAKEFNDAAKRVLALKEPVVVTRTAPQGFAGEVRFGVALCGRRAGEAGDAVDIVDRAEVVGEEDKAGVDRRDVVLLNLPRSEAAGVPPVQQAEDEKQAAAKSPARRELRAKLDAVPRDAFAPMMERMALVAVRQYAHVVRPARKPGERTDFAETVFWDAGVKTDAATGTVKVAFDLSDAVTTFRVFADAFDARGALGAGTATIESVEPFYISPKFPLEVTAGDKVLLPVGLVSALSQPLLEGQISVNTDPEITVGKLGTFLLQPDERGRMLIPLEIGLLNGEIPLTIHASAQAFGDSVTRPLKVQPRGFPVTVSFGGILNPDSTITQKIVVPANVVLASVTSDTEVYPTPLANLTQALQRLIQEPNGCFEQTSSTTYPLTMAQQYFLSHPDVDPALIEQSREKLDHGYARLVSFECEHKGYEWFGADPGHETLSAYGLMHFTDMAKVRDVDPDMLARTRAWVLKTRDGKGGFTRERRALHTWVEDRACSNAYILWTLLESGEQGLDKEVAWVRQAGHDEQNSYVWALAANCMALAGDTAESSRLMQQLAQRQDDTGVVTGATASIVGSQGVALNIETTAFAVLAWLRDPAFTASVERGIKYLADSCQDGRFGSTQSTVLALRAIVAYDKARSKPKTAGTLHISVDGQSIGGPQAFDEKHQGTIELPDISELLTPGEHKVELRMEGGSAMPYSLAVNYYDERPPSSDECKMRLAVSLTNAELAEGELTEANVVVENLADEAIPTPIAIIGLPGGLEPRHDQLKELVKAGRIAAYEVSGREIVLYWRSMSAKEKVELPLSLVAAIPGEYTGPASRAYLYYTDEFKDWAAPLRATVTPRD